MKVTVNGDNREVAEGTTVLSLLQELGLRPELMAVQLNEIIIDREKYAETFIEEGDTVELIRFVAGG